MRWHDLEDYPAAALRHLKDAEMLLRHRRFDNTYYLSGYVVECVFKTVITHGGLPARPFAHRLTSLHQGLVFLGESSALWYRYHPRWPAPLADWSPEVRYARSGRVDGSSAKEAFESAKANVRDVLAAMILDGLVDEVL
jgi:HEPN domain-containing protein